MRARPADAAESDRLQPAAARDAGQDAPWIEESGTADRSTGDAEPRGDAPAESSSGPFRRSCAEILAAEPRSRDGMYTIDPDGAGPRPPASVFCDMTSVGGGWTRVVMEDFSNPGAVSAFSRNTVTTCGGFGAILGGHKTFGNETITASFDLRGVPHREVRVKFDFVVLDSWDHEVAFAELDAVRFWSIRCDKGSASTCNQASDQCGWDGLDRNDGKVPVDAILSHARDQAVLAVAAVLDQTTADESWGLDNLAIYVR